MERKLLPDSVLMWQLKFIFSSLFGWRFRLLHRRTRSLDSIRFWSISIGNKISCPEVLSDKNENCIRNNPALFLSAAPSLSALDRKKILPLQNQCLLGRKLESLAKKILSCLELDQIRHVSKTPWQDMNNKLRFWWHFFVIAGHISFL